MIKVNLVESARPVGRRPGLRVGAGQQLPLIGALILLLVALGVGWRYWDLTQQTAALDQQIAAAQQEEAKLAGILQQVQTFEARRQQLQQRVALIDELRKGQAAPVHMIDQISRALPDGMWLTQLQQKGYEISIDGECLSLTALSDFVGNLEASEYFTRPVEIINSAVVAGGDDRPDVIKFSVKGTFQMAGIEPAPAKPAAPGGKRG